MGLPEVASGARGCAWPLLRGHVAPRQSTTGLPATGMAPAFILRGTSWLGFMAKGTIVRVLEDSWGASRKYSREGRGLDADPINTGTQVPPSMAQGAALGHTRHQLGHVSRERHLSGLVHFGVVNEMSCQTNGGGGSQSERMNCSLRKPRVPPIPPHEGQGAGRGRGHTPQHPHLHLCGPAARGAWGAGFQPSYF